MCRREMELQKTVFGLSQAKVSYFLIRLLLIALANKYNSELGSRLKSEEKSLKVMMNGFKNLENLVIFRVNVG